MKILVLEDETRLRELLVRSLRSEGYHVDSESDGVEGFEKASSGGYDLILLDLMLPRMSGLEISMRLRKRKSTAAILMLTARDTVEDRVAGLDAGADDYLIKPFAMVELLARARALLRRGKDPSTQDKLLIEDLELDRIRREVRRGTVRTELTAREFSLLEYLMKNTGRVLSRDQILAAVWQSDYAAGPSVVDTYIHYLREKIDHKPFVTLIHTVRGVGYMLGPK